MRLRCKDWGHNVPKGFQTEHPDAYVEVCIDCGDKLIYNKSKTGQIDNARYYREHLRTFVQSTGKTSGLYRQLYGIPKTDVEATESFWKDRDAQRVENWERGMKANESEGWAKKMKPIVNP